MEIISLSAEKIILPLPIYKSIKIAEAIGKEGDKFSIFIGLDQSLVEQLKKYSADKSDTELQKNTSDWKRFVEGTYEEWYKKNRTSFALVHNESGAMAAIMRFGPEPLLKEVSNWHTIGWRSYNPWRGKGVMKDFAKFTLDFYLQSFTNIKFWISARKENTGSIKLAEFLDFKTDEEKSKEISISENREALVMIRDKI